ncbi:MAG: four helix bundle protein [Dysgonamonadaceae bacterium]|jgi:four helix bundle protein|nr:four helix bundle protein [Dysgonamonadaceae bacterium]
MATHKELTVCKKSMNVEGHGRCSEKELVRFLFISLGSVSEIETQLTGSCPLDFLTNTGYEKALNPKDEVRKMLVSLIRNKNNGKLINESAK